jgi:hypothetical protein
MSSSRISEVKGSVGAGIGLGKAASAKGGAAKPVSGAVSSEEDERNRLLWAGFDSDLYAEHHGARLEAVYRNFGDAASSPNLIDSRFPYELQEEFEKVVASLTYPILKKAELTTEARRQQLDELVVFFGDGDLPLDPSLGDPSELTLGIVSLSFFRATHPTFRQMFMRTRSEVNSFAPQLRSLFFFWLRMAMITSGG